MTSRAIRNWLADKNRPNDLTSIERELFGENPAYEEWRHQIRAAYNRTWGRSRAADTDPAPGTVVNRPPLCVGRDTQVAALRDALFADESGPAILVLGGAGIGKTNLTLEGASHPDVLARFGARRWFVPLETVNDATALESAVVAAVGLNPATARFDSAVVALAESPAVLVFDNLETPWEQDRTNVEELLRRIAELPGVALIASLRGLESPGQVPWREQIEVRPLDEQDSAHLFREKAPRVAADDPHLGPLLSELGGIPLAIELIAHQAAPFANLEEVWAEWLRVGIELAERSAVEPSRLDSLERSLALSLRSPRLSDDGRRLFRFLGQLPAGIASEDCRVLLAEGAFAARRDLLAVGLAVERRDRIDLLPPVRDFARRYHVPRDEDADAWRMHYLNLAGNRASRIWFADGAGVTEHLMPELPNLVASVRAAIASRCLPQWVAVEGVSRLMATTGLGSLDMLQEAANGYRAAGDVLGEANSITILADIAVGHSRHAEARGRFEEGLQLYRQIGAILGEANCIKGLGDIALARSDHAEARRHFEQALPLYRQVEDFLGEANCMRGLGDIALARSDRVEARGRYKEALPLCRRVGDVLGEANCIIGLGHIAHRRSDYAEARKRYEEALPLYRQVGAVLGEANCMRGLGDIALARSDHVEARGRYEEALSLYRQFGDVLGEANCIKGLGNIALRCRDFARAGRLYKEALTLYQLVGSVVGEANCISSLGDIALKHSNHAEAQQRFENALSLYERIADPFSIGHSHCRLAIVCEGAERADHVAAARAAWLSINRSDLLFLLGDLQE